MGHNFPKELALQLARTSKIKVFIETGTYKGETAEWASRHFQHVTTIEAFRPRFDKTSARLANTPRLRMMYGDSRVVLAQVLSEIAEPVMLWLDAHWCGLGASDAHEVTGDECPLRDELDAINNHAWASEHIILIDDARLFENPPPFPHDPKQWPSMVEIRRELARFPRSFAVFNDMIIAVPLRYEEVAQKFVEELVK